MKLDLIDEALRNSFLRYENGEFFKEIYQALIK